MENIPCFPGWEVVEQIGGGHFGAVYEIKKESEGAFSSKVEHSAMKVIAVPPSQAELKSLQAEYGDDATVTTLLRSQVDSISQEFEVMSQLQGHSNIVTYHDHSIIQQDGGVGWNILIRMELLTSLSDYSKGNEMTEEKIIRLGMDMCCALERCEQCKILHRDIKPQNIFVNKYGDFKLGDFGIARIAEHLTASTIAGTYNYMAPEIYFNAGKYDERVDIYSLGLVLYWLLNKRRGPFLPLPPEIFDSRAQNAAMKKRMEGEALPRPATGSRELQDIVLKACAYKPEDRYQNAVEFYNALQPLSVKPSDKQESEKQENDEETVPMTREELEKYNKKLGLTPGYISEPEGSAAAEKKEQAQKADEETVPAFEERKTSAQAEAVKAENAESGKAQVAYKEKLEQRPKKSKSLLFICIAAACVVVVLIGVLGYTNCWFGHRWDDGAVTTAATHTAPGTRVYTCTVCGQNKEETIAQLTEHTYDQETVDAQYLKTEATCTDSAVYYKSCKCGEAGTETFTYGDAKGHSWDGGVVTVAATHTSTGTETYTCTVCGQTREEAIAQSATHTYDRENASEQYLMSAATCTSAAVYYKSCECGEAGTETFTYGAFGEHTWVSATCTAPQTCSVCGVTEGSANGHNWQDATAFAPQTCLVCGEQTGSATTAVATGTCGDNLEWALDNVGTLAIRGSGKMYDYMNTDAPWESQKDAITKVVIENGVTSIGYGAFSDFTNLTSVSVPDSVISIEAYAFGWCSALTSITIPDSVTTMSGTAFAVCTGLQEILVDGDNKHFVSVEGVLFSKDRSEIICYPSAHPGTSYTIPNDVITIGRDAFDRCYSLVSISIPNSVTSIGDRAFMFCENLTSIIIPESVNSIELEAFLGCDSLQTISVDSSNESFADVDGVLFSKNKSELIRYPSAHAGTAYAIPDSVSTIEYGAFYGCSGLETISIPDSVTFIGVNAFMYCSSLISVDIPNSVKSIGTNAFFKCVSLTSVTIPASMTKIHTGTFQGCSALTSVTIPSSITSIEQWAFNCCSNLRDVYYDGTESDRENKLDIDNDRNSALLNATWHYNS